MKTAYLRQFLSAACGLAAIPAVLCAAPDMYAVRLPPGRTVASLHVNPPPTLALIPVQAPQNPPAAIDTPDAEWVNIKDCTYAQRDTMLAGLEGLMARVEAQIAELDAKRATMTGTTSTRDWDFAMQEMLNARSYLKSMTEELAKATPETWEQQRERVGQAWTRTQNAYGKVKASTTN